MNKTLIIIRREFLYRVKKKSFILLTLLMPILMVALSVVPMLLAQIEDESGKLVVVVDKTGRYAPLFKSDESYTFQIAPSVIPEFRDENSEVEAVVNITAPLDVSLDSVKIYSRTEVSNDLLMRVQQTLNEQVHRDKLLRYNVPQLDSLVADLEKSVNVTTVKWSEEGETISNTAVSMGIGMVFAFLIYMFVLAYGGMVMQSVIEEKTNRIVEIIVSSVKPFQLMMGKIVGVGLVGILQFALWAVLAMIIFTGVGFFFLGDMTQAVATQGVATSMEGMGEIGNIFKGLGSVPFGEIVLMFLLYFVGGYLLFASFFAAVGASINEQEDATQFNLPLIAIMMFSLYAAMGASANPNGPLAFWASMFPLTSPIVMMVRVPFSVPLWQELLSLALLFGTALLFIWMGARIYRVGILMYGKKPTLKEMFKWMRYH